MPLLTDLPPELLLLITDLLPPADLLCLSLSTHTLYDHLSSQPPSARARKALAKANPREACLRRGFPRPGEIWNAEREAFLLRLERDQHQTRDFFCYYCAFLHRCEWINPGGRFVRRCWRREVVSFVYCMGCFGLTGVEDDILMFGVPLLGRFLSLILLTWIGGRAHGSCRMLNSVFLCSLLRNKLPSDWLTTHILQKLVCRQTSPLEQHTVQPG